MPKYRVKTEQGDYFITTDRELSPDEQTPDALGSLLQGGQHRPLPQTPASPAAPSTGERAMQLANRFAQGGLEGAAGLIDLPMHLVNAVVNAENYAFTGGQGQRFDLPGVGGARELVRRYQEATGSQPVQPQGLSENLARALGEQLTGAALTYGAGGMMPAGGLASKALSSGNLGADATLAAGAGLGQGVAETIEPNSPLYSMAGQMAGGLAPAVPRAAGRAGLSAMGIASPSVGKESGLTAAQQYRAQLFADQGIRPAASDVTGNRGTAALELFPTRFPIGGQRTQDFAEGQMTDATRATSRAFAPLGKEMEPMEVGLAAQRDVSGKKVTEEAAAGASMDRLISTIGPRTSRLQSVTAARRNIEEVQQTFRDTKRVLFDATEEVTGDTPVVSLTHLHGASGPMLSEASQTGMGAPRGTGTMDRLGRPVEDAGTAELRSILTPEYLAKLPPAQRAKAESFLGAGEDQPIPFWLARRIQSQLGETAFGHGQPLGNLSQGKAAGLWHGITRDIDDFLDSTPEGMAISPKLQEAKQYYSTNRTMLNDTVVNQLASKRGRGETVLNTVFGSGKNLDPVLDLKSAVSDDTWQRLMASGFAQGFEQAMTRAPDGTQAFNPAAFVKWGDALEKSGKLDFLLTPVQREQWNTEMSNMAGLGKTRIAQVDDLLTTPKDPEKIVDQVFKPGALQRTQQFSEVADPAVFQDVVRAWATKLQQDITIPKGKTASGERDLVASTQLARELQPLIRSGQLDIMLKPFPGMADNLKQLVEVSQGLGKRETLAGNPSGTAQALLAAGQIGTILAGISQVGLGAVTGNPALIASGAVTAGGAVGVPYGISRFTTSETGRRVLTEGLQDKYSMPALRLMERILAPDVDNTGSQKPGLHLDLQHVLPNDPVPTQHGIAAIRG